MTSERRAQVKEIYEETLAKQASERLSFLRERCAADEELQAEVLHMLVESATAKAPASDATATITDVPGGSFALGELVCDRFRILRLLGRGGMGEVYEAEDLELHGHVALKTIRPDRAFNDSMQSRFRQEVHLARRVTHRNVCRIFDVYRHASTVADGSKQDVLFVTMEFLEGDTLGNHLRVHGPFAPADALPVARQIAEGLSAAHSAGVVHRDFKPGNVMLVHSQSGASRAVVTDFGIAQSMLASNAGNDVDTVTRAGVIVGTPAYMAPEQLKGQPATPASDVYALGLVLREMLTSERSATQPVAPPFRTVIQRCLEHDPGKRYQSASEVVTSLQWSAGGPPACPGAWVRRPFA